MFHTTEYDPPIGTAVRHAVSAPAGRSDTAVSADDRTDTPRTLSGWAVFVLALIFVAMAAVGSAGAYGTYRNMKSAFDDSGTALGLVAAGEGATAVLGLTLIGLTLISRPYPLALRLGLWLIPVAGSAAGLAVADDAKHGVVYAITPLAMTAAAELAGYLARSIVVHRTGVDAEADRRTGEMLRLIEFHQARSQRHPKENVRGRSERAAWRLARRLGRDDPRLGTALSSAYADRTTGAALAALDTLYGRIPTSADTEPVPPVSPMPEAVPVAPVVEELVFPEAPVEVPADEPEPTPDPEPTDDEAVEVPGQLRFDTDDDAFDAADTDRAESDAEADTAVPPAPPAPGARLTDVELDVVVHMIRTETDPPRSYRDMEGRFRELGYIAGAARLRAAWDRIATADTVSLTD